MSDNKSYRFTGEIKKGSPLHFLMSCVSKKEEFPPYLSCIYSDHEEGRLISTDGRVIHVINESALQCDEGLPTGLYIPETTKNRLFLTPKDSPFPAYKKVFNFDNMVKLPTLPTQSIDVFQAGIIIEMIRLNGFEAFSKDPITFSSVYLKNAFDLTHDWCVFTQKTHDSARQIILSSDFGHMVLMPIAIKYIH